MRPLERLIRSLRRLPSIGEKSATRLALFILRDTKGLAQELIDTLSFVRDRVKFCKICQNLTEEDPCPLCRDSSRDPSVICVVQEPVDLMMMEKTGTFKGLYHILHGAISPLDGIGPEEIRMEDLVRRVREGKVREVILATDQNAEGEATALYIKQALSTLGTKMTRIASGVPVGGTIEFTDPQTLARSLDNRREF